MTLACPACRAENTERTCRRCKADLGILWDLEAERGTLLAEAAAAFERRDFELCIERAEAALQLRHAPDACQIIACAQLLRRRFHRALEWHHRGTSPRS